MIGASTLALIAGAAQADPTLVFGGGSSLISPYARNAFDCYGNAVQLVTPGTTPLFQSFPGFDWTSPTTPTQCTGSSTPPTGTTVDSNVTFYYASTGSGTGIQALVDQRPATYGNTSPQVYSSVHYAFSETAINANDVSVWNTGAGADNSDGTHNTEGQNEVAGKVVNVMAPGDTPGTNGLGQQEYPSPLGTYGHLIQVPISIDPVDIVFSQAYRKVRNGDGTVTTYSFNLKQVATINGVSTPVLRLDQATYCKIFTGQITNWNDPALKALNKNTSLQDLNDHSTFDVPMQIVGRNDSSGTTGVWTRHLAVACSGSAYLDATTTLPASLRSLAYYVTGQPNNQPPNGLIGGSTHPEQLGKYTVADQSQGVSEYVSFSQPEDQPGPNNGDTIVSGRIGYVGNDFVTNPTYITAYGLSAAAILNPQGTGSTTTYVYPSVKSATLSFGLILPPQSDSKGNYVAANTANGFRTDPSVWVQPTSKTSVLAFPQVKGGYPIIGTTNALLYTCYADNGGAGSLLNRGYKVNQFFYYYFKNKIITDTTTGELGILAFNGLSSMPAAWKTAIVNTFIKPVTTGSFATNGLNLWVSTKSNITSKKFTHNPACDTVPGA
jgi:ABC-type phosphate transport system substrate-binding protein